MQEYEGGRDMEFGEMLDWASRLRTLAALRAWVGARGPAGGIGADGSHSTRILKVDRHLSVHIQLSSRPMAATTFIMGDFTLDADLGPPCPSECDFRI